MEIKKISKDIMQFSEASKNVRDVSIVDITNYINKIDRQLTECSEKIITLNKAKDLQQSFLDEFNKLNKGESKEIISPKINTKSIKEPIKI